MFYAHYVLSKRGPLARIWLAAHWDKKITKTHVFEVNLEDSVDSIISPQVKMALRTSGHLLLGVVRIYNRKSKYLLADCNEAFIKIKSAFRSGVVDLPMESREAKHKEIYIAVEEYPSFDTPLPEIGNFDVDQNLTIHQSRLEEITIPEEVPTMSVGMDDDMEAQFGFFNKEGDQGISGFGIEDSGLIGDGGLFGENTGLFGDDFNKETPQQGEDNIIQDDGPAENQQQSSPQPQQTEQPTEQMEIDEQATSVEQQESNQQQPSTSKENLPPVSKPMKSPVRVNPSTATPQPPQLSPQQPPQQQETTFALGPVIQSDVRDVRIRRKRKLVVDQLIELDGQTMRDQLRSVDDIVTQLDMAPPTKRLMQWKEMGTSEKLFSLPARTSDSILTENFKYNLHNRVPDEFRNVSSEHLDRIYGTAQEDEVIPQDSSIQQGKNSTMGMDSTIQNALDAERSHQRLLDQSSIVGGPGQQKLETSSIVGNPPDEFGRSSVFSNQQDSGPCMNTINAVVSDDDYDANSMGGPPSVGASSFGGGNSPMMIPPTDNSQLFDINVDPVVTSHNNNDDVTMGRFGADDNQQNVEQEQEEGVAYADDLEDLKHNKRTQYLIKDLDKKFKSESEVSFFRLSDGIKRKQAVSKFYSLLVLAKQEATHLSQSDVFGDVYIKKGPKFDLVCGNQVA